MPDALLNDPQTAISEATRRIEPELIAIRRDLHAHPELAFHEIRTAGVVARELEKLGIPHRTGVGRTGVVGLIEGGRPGPVLAIRGDMDALPIREQTGLPFASTVDGRMHACGHDVHTSTLLGVASVLKELAPRLAGTIKLVFQPAEELLDGMAAMIADGVLEEPKVDMALGYHNHPDTPVGRFGFARGACLAASDRFDVTVRGRSGHAAYPHTAVDPIVAAATLVTQLQTVVAREVKPTHPAVVTIGAIHGGSARNIIPDACMLKGTVRTLDAETRDTAEHSIRRLCAGLAEGMRVTCEVDYVRGVPPLVNDDGVLERAVASVRGQFGDVITEGGPKSWRRGFRADGRTGPGFSVAHRLGPARARGQAAQLRLSAR